MGMLNRAGNRAKGFCFYVAAMVASMFGLWFASPAKAQNPFSIVVLPDTQFYTCGKTNNLTQFWSQINWIVSNRVSRNIQLVLHVGDITDSNTPPEWVAASNVMRRLETNDIPYVLTIGNHDMGTNGNAYTRETLFNTYFPWSQATSKPWWGGAYETGRLENAYYFFTIGGIDWLVLALEFGPRDAVLQWADQVVAQHPNHRVILLTHAHVAPDGTLHGSSYTHISQPRDYGLDNQSGHPNCGAEIWQKLIRKHSLMAFALCGHVLPPSGGAHCLMTNDYGTVAYQLVSNYQHLNGGDGFLRIKTFIPEENSVTVSTYSPFLNEWRTDPDNTFTLRQVRVFDTTPPPGPSNLLVTPLPNHRARVKWDSPLDLESGIASYAVFLNGSLTNIVLTNSLLLYGLSENAAYTVTVKAVNGAGLGSIENEPAEWIMPPDIQPSKIMDILAKGNKLRLWFSEALDPSTATNLANFELSGGASVTAAYWKASSNALTLLTTPLTAGERYLLTINGVSDMATVPNVATNLRRRFITAPCLLWEEFERGNMIGWLVVDQGTLEGPSRWGVSNGVLWQTSNIYGPDGSALMNRRGTYAYWSAQEAFAWSQYVFQVRIRTADDDGIGVIFHYQNPSNYCKVDMDAQRNMRKLFEVVNGVETTLAATNGTYRLNEEMSLVVRVGGRVVSAELNGQPIWSGSITTTVQNAGTIGLYCWGSAGVEFSQIEVSPMAEPTTTEQDSDDDGLPDSWERDLVLRNPDYFISIDDVNPQDDADDDGFTVVEEFLADTDPLDRQSFFRCEVRSDENGALRLQWPGNSACFYDVLHASSLSDAFTNFLIGLTTNTSSVPAGNDAGFFSLRVRLPPGL